VRVTSEARCTRDELARELERRGVQTGIYYPDVVFDHPCYRGDPRVRAHEVPNARRAAREVLSLPVHPRVSADDLSHIVQVTREALGC
jgi:dTDP-4-amino-4,6-dideoxygalactose transaminase